MVTYDMEMTLSVHESNKIITFLYHYHWRRIHHGQECVKFDAQPSYTNLQHSRQHPGNAVSAKLSAGVGNASPRHCSCRYRNGKVKGTELPDLPFSPKQPDKGHNRHYRRRKKSHGDKSFYELLPRLECL